MDMNAMVAAFATALKGQAAVAKADGTPVTTYLYSEGGLFGTAKQDPVLINAMVGPFGVMGALDWIGVDHENPIYQSITRITTSGTAQSTACGDCGTPTILRCAQTSCFGRICQQSEEMQYDELGLKANVNVPRLALFGNITDPQGNILIGMGQPITDLFTLSVAAAAYSMRREVGELMWTGNPTNNAGGYAEFSGFNLIINTGKIDALTGIACDGLDSTLLNFSSDVVGASGSRSIVRYISAVVRQILYRIDTAGLDRNTANIMIVMHPNVADCVFDAWACEYGINCQTGATPRNDALASAELRDDLKRRQVLRVDGREYPVVLDNSINQTVSYLGDDTNMCSDIYVITKSVSGRRITWGEYQDFNRTGGTAEAFFRRTWGATSVAATDGGRYAIAPGESGGFCFDAKILTKPRIIALMPQLLGRVQNVCCNPLKPFPAASGSGGLYEVDGGATTVPPNYLYGDCFPNAASGPISGPRA